MDITAKREAFLSRDDNTKGLLIGIRVANPMVGRHLASSARRDSHALRASKSHKNNTYRGLFGRAAYTLSTPAFSTCGDSAKTPWDLKDLSQPTGCSRKATWKPAIYWQHVDRRWQNSDTVFLRAEPSSLF